MDVPIYFTLHLEKVAFDRLYRHALGEGYGYSECPAEVVQRFVRDNGIVGVEDALGLPAVRYTEHAENKKAG